VTGVVAALKPGDNIRFTCIEINNLSFSFITPLSAYNRNIGHDSFPTFLWV